MSRIAEHFDGATFDQKRDGARLSGQLERVYNVISDGQWWGLKSIAYVVRGSEAGVSARLRDLRKPRFGGHIIEKRCLGGGNWEYRIGRSR